MLRELTVENFALIERLTLEFGDGLTVLTGETGAGKSIVVEALALALGARGDTGLIRTGTDGARVDCVFDIGDEVARLVADLGHEASDGTLIIGRTLASDGRSRCWINGRPATVGNLSAIGDLLVDFHGQHEHQHIFKTSTHIGYLDRFTGQEGAALRAAYSQARAEFVDARSRLSEALANSEAEAEKRRIMRNKLRELEGAGIADPCEDESLELERTRLRNMSKIHEAVSTASHALDSSDATGGSSGALDSLAVAAEALRQVADIDPDLSSAHATLSGLSLEADEAHRSLRAYSQMLSFSPDRQSEIEERLAILKDLKERFGPSLAEVIRARDVLRDEVGGEGDEESLVDTLRERHDLALSRMGEAARALSALRAQHGAKLSAEISSQLAELALRGASFEVRQSVLDILDAKADGTDDVEFLVALNPGEPLSSLAKSASGGEASRVMLAIKLALRQADPVPTLVFDEVDAGIGGETAASVGNKLSELGSDRQVICVTHLAQVAIHAKRHVRVGKQSHNGRTISVAASLDNDERITEVARMLGGNPDLPASLSHAKELLKNVD